MPVQSNYDKHYSISEASTKLRITPQLLRLWESQGHFSPKRNSRGHRYYTQKDLETLKGFQQKINSKAYVAKVTEERKSEKDEIKTKANAQKLQDKIFKTKLYSTIALAIVVLGLATFLGTYLSLTKKDGNVRGTNKSGERIATEAEKAVLGKRDRETDYQFIVNVPTNLAKGLTVDGDALFNGDISTPSVNLTGLGSLAGLTDIDATTENTLEDILDLTGDVEGPLNDTTIAVGTVTGVMLTDNLEYDGTIDITGTLEVDGSELDPAYIDLLADIDAEADDINTLEGVTTTAGGVIYTDGSTMQNTDAGTAGQVLTSNGAAAPTWAEVSDADTLDTLDSLQFLRSDTSDAFTSGTLSFSDDTFLDLSAIQHDDTATQGIRLPQNDVLSAPASGEGYIAYDTDADKVYIYNGTSWTDVSGASTPLQEAYEGGSTIAMSAGEGDVRFYNDASSEILFLDEDAGRVGIGNTTPEYKLDVTGTLQATGFRTNSETVTSFSGTGITVTGGALTSTLGTSIVTTEIVNDTILEADFDATNSPTDGLILSFDTATGGFTWVPNDGGSGASKWTDGGATTYLTSVTDDLAIGGDSLTGSVFALDESEATFYVGYDNSSSPEFLFESADGDQGTFGFNNDDTFYISGANFQVGAGPGSYALDVAGDFNADSFYLGDSQVISTAAEINVLDGITSSTTELNLLTGRTGALLDTSSSFSGDVSGVYNNLQIGSGTVGTSELANDSILEIDLDSTNSPTDDYVLSYDQASGGFTWIAGGGGTIDGSGTGTYLTMWSDSDTIANSSVFEDSGKIGIGTTTPNALLSVNSAGSNISINNPTDGQGLILQGVGGGTNGQLRIIANSAAWADNTTTAYFQIKTGSNNNATFMGGTYGADAPFDRLQFNSEYTTITNDSYTDTPVATAVFEVVNDTDARDILQIIGSGSQSGDYLQVTSNGGAAGNLLTVDSNGDLGVGTTNPGYKLDVVGVAQASSGFRTNSETVTSFSGTGITVTGGALTSTLGTSIVTTEITDDEILEVDLDVTNSPTDNYILSYDSGTTGFTWVEETGGDGASKWTDGGTTTYLTSLSDDIGIGHSGPSSELFFDTSASALTLNPFGTSSGNTGEIRISELVASGTNYTGFKAPDSLGSDITYTLPNADGTADYVLTWQTGGALEWKEVTGVGGAGDITAVGSMGSGSVFSGATADDDWLGLGAAAGRIEFDDQATDEVNILDAYVGIGTSNPGSKLEIGTADVETFLQWRTTANEGSISRNYNTTIFSNTGTWNYQYNGSTSRELKINSSTNTSDPWELETEATALDFKAGIADGANAVAYTLNTTNTLSTSGARILDIQNNDTNLVSIDKSGNVGIGTTAPGYGLEVNGTLQADDFYAGDGTQGADATTGGLTFKDGLYTAGTISSVDHLQNLAEVYAQDGSTGNAVELTATNGDIRFYNDGGSEILFLDESSGYVGIGTTAPNNIFEVKDLIKFGTVGNLYSVYVGSLAGGVNSTGDGLTVIGRRAGYAMGSSTDYVVALGYNAGYFNTGDYAIALGTSAAQQNSGDNVLAFGRETGKLNSGADSIFIGNYQGDSNSTANRLLIGNNATLSLMDGIMTDSAATSRLTINGNVGIGTTNPSVKLDVVGAITSSTTVTADTSVSTPLLALSGTGTINGLDAVDSTTENTIEGLIFDADAENITGAWEVQDNVTFAFGDEADIKFIYDETSDDRFELTDSGDNLFLDITDQGSTAEFAFNVDDMFIDDDGKVGIGNTAPATALHVNGTVTVVGNIDLGLNNQIILDDDDNTYITATGDDRIGTYAGGTKITDVFNISGGVRHELRQTATNYESYYVLRGASQGAVETEYGGFEVRDSGGDATAGMYFANLGGGANEGELYFEVRNNGGTTIEPMRLTSAGNVGIGTTNPGYKLEVNGTMQADDFYSGDGTQGATSTVSGLVYKDGLFTSGTISGFDNYASWTAQDGDTTTYTITSADTLQIEEGTGIDSDFTADDVLTISHLTGDGYSHIPSTGSSAQILQYSSAGVAKWVTVSSDIAIADGGAMTIQANAVVLGTDTSGNYVATVADAGSGHLTVSGSGSETAAVTLSIAADSLDFTELSDTLALDASTSITQDGSETLTFTNSGTGNTTFNLSSTGDFDIQDNGTSAFFVKDDGAVGIGTTNPGKKLDVLGDSADIRIVQADSAQSVILGSDDNGVGFLNLYNDGGTDLIHLVADGESYINVANVGIGITDPSYLLEVNGTMQADDFYSGDGTQGAGTTTGGLTFKDGLYTSGSATTYDHLQNLAEVYAQDGSTGNAVELTATNGDIRFYNDGGNEMLFLDESSGYVGIGNTAPATKLQIVGSSDIKQVTILANSSQSSNIFDIQDSSGNVLAGFDERGILFSDMNTGTSNFFAGNNAGNISASGATDNIAIGDATLDALTDGDANIALGSNTLGALTTGQYNIALGQSTMSEGIVNGGHNNVALGQDSLDDLTSGDYNVAIGYQTGQNLTTADQSIAIGEQAMSNGIVTGASNIGIGTQALNDVAAGFWNVAMGRYAMDELTTGDNNIAIGANVMDIGIVTGDDNIALGQDALDDLTSGANNIAIGEDTAQNLTTAANNIAIGLSTMDIGVVTGEDNIAIGQNALDDLTSGFDNIAIGENSTINLTEGAYNIGIGVSTMSVGVITGQNNIAMNQDALDDLTSGNNNIALGEDAAQNLTTGSNNIAIGNEPMDAGIVTGDDNIALGQDALDDLTSGANNIVLGENAAQNLTTGSNNVAVGNNAISLGITSGIDNIAMGQLALNDLTSGTGNIALGYYPATNLTTANYNIALGFSTMDIGVVTGQDNIAIGQNALDDLTGGTNNIVLGENTAQNLTTGSNNIALGNAAIGTGVVTGADNIALGSATLEDVTSGTRNIAIGLNAADELTTGYDNIAIGSSPMSIGITTGNNNITLGTDVAQNLTEGSGNIALGLSAMNLGVVTGDDNIAVGHNALYDLTSGSNNIVLGEGTAQNLTTGDNNIALGISAISNGTGTNDNNIAIGQDVLDDLTSGANNIGLGEDSAQNLTTGANNIIIGNSTMSSGVVTGGNNIAIGRDALDDLTSGANNIVLGEDTAQNLTTGSNNVAIGNAAIGTGITTGSDNTVIGAGGGAALTSGATNVLLGHDAGAQLTTESNLLYIDNSNTTTPLVWGDFSSDFLTVHGSLGIGTTAPATNLHVNGGAIFGDNDLVIDEGPYNYYDTKYSIANSTYTYGGVDNDYINFLSDLRVDSSVNNAEILDSINAFVSTESGNSADHGKFVGINSRAAHDGTGTVTGLYGLNSGAINNSTGTVTDSYGIVAYIGTNNGTLTNTYGIYIDDVTNGTQTNQAFGLYQADTGARNYFAGNVGIGTTDPSVALDVVGAITSSTTVTANTSVSTPLLALSGTGTINGLDAVDSTTENTIEGLIFDSDAENVSGVWEVQDNVAFSFGNEADFGILYDETTDDRLELADASSNLFLDITDQGTTAEFAFNADDMFIDDNGYVGIGTTNPGSILNVGQSTIANPTIRINGSANGGSDRYGYTFGFTSSTTDYAGLGMDYTDRNTLGLQLFSTTYPISFTTGAVGTTPDMFINTSGNVGIGTTAPTPTSGSRKVLQIEDTTNDAEWRLIGTSGIELVGKAISSGVLIGSKSNTNLGILVNNGQVAMFDTSGSAYIGDTSNAFMTQGLTINQGANDNEILALKSSDVAHGMTDFSETDTFTYFRKFNATTGGLFMGGFSEDTVGVRLSGFITNDTTTKTTSSVAAINLNPGKKSGTSVGAMGTDANLLSIRNNSTTKLIIDAEGTIHQIPGSDTDIDLLTVQVTGTPTLSWDESQDQFDFNKGANFAGNVGIGTTGPSENLHIEGSGSQEIFVNSTGGGGEAVLTMDAHTGTTFDITVKDAATADRVDFRMATSPKMTILANGNVGIGTTNPGQELEVSGDLQATNYYSGDGTQGATTTESGLVFKDGLYTSGSLSASVAWDDIGDPDGNNTINLSTYTTQFDFTGTTTTGWTYNADSLTTGTGQLMSFDALTTGTGVSLASTSTALTTGSLMTLDWSPGSSTTATGDLFSINIGANGSVDNLFAIYDNTSDVFTVSETQITSAVPHAFTASGDVSMAYDLIMSNQTSSKIESYGPFELEVGESFENNDLTITTYGTGAMVVGAAGGSEFTRSGATVATFDRTSSDGTIISLQQAGTEEGTISVSTTTVSYNAFTGSHYAWAEESVLDTLGIIDSPTTIVDGEEVVEETQTNFTPEESKGLLVSLTGNNKHLHDRQESEMLYGIDVTAVENDSKVMGAFLAPQEGNRAVSIDNPLLVMAVGNADIWVSDTGENISSGDYLTSSSAPGHARIDNPNNEVSYIIARAAEDVDWTDIDAYVDDSGVKHTKISVFFESFIIDRSLMLASNNTLESDVALIKDLLGLSDALESSESDSSTLPGLSGLVSEITEVYTEFKEFTEALGLSKIVDEDGNDLLAIESNMTVTGNTSLADVTITGDVMAGLIKIDTIDNSIGVVGPECDDNKELCQTQTLYLQNTLAGNVDILDGTVVITPEGILKVEGTVEAKVFAVNVEDTLGATAGKVTIEKGQTTIEVQTTALTDTSLILATPREPVRFATKKTGSDTFEINLGEEIDTDVEFDWFIVQVTTESGN
jgi:hypothetical protein